MPPSDIIKNGVFQPFDARLYQVPSWFAPHAAYMHAAVALVPTDSPCCAWHAAAKQNSGAQWHPRPPPGALAMLSRQDLLVTPLR